MSNKRISLKDMPEVSRKECAARILQARDNVGRQARKSITAALTDWRSSVPVGDGRRYGHLRDAPSIESSVGQGKLVIPEGALFYKLNSFNKYGKNAGFYDKWKRKVGRPFQSKAIEAANKALH